MFGGTVKAQSTGRRSSNRGILVRLDKESRARVASGRYTSHFAKYKHFQNLLKIQDFGGAAGGQPTASLRKPSYFLDFLQKLKNELVPVPRKYEPSWNRILHFLTHLRRKYEGSFLEFLQKLEDKLGLYLGEM